MNKIKYQVGQTVLAYECRECKGGEITPCMSCEGLGYIFTQDGVKLLSFIRSSEEFFSRFKPSSEEE